MVTPNKKLATSLKQLWKLQGRGRLVFRSGELTRVHRERLVRNGFLSEVMKGWLLLSSPDADPDRTPWIASFWEFCAAYCTDRFGQDWHLSPEQSLLLNAENTVIPQQVIIYTSKGTNNIIKPPLFRTSLYDLRQKDMPPKADLAERDGLRLFVPEAALVRVSEDFFVRHKVDARVVLSGIRNATGVLEQLLDGGHSVIAGRLAGAFRLVGNDDVANEILNVMKRTGYDVRETDPFVEPEQPFGVLSQAQVPIVCRLQSLWETMREAVIAAFPDVPGLPKDTKAYLSRADGNRQPAVAVFPDAPVLPKGTKAYLSCVDDIYQNDAYHSLSIEGYRVTPELIDRVSIGSWDPENNNADRQVRDTLAARGYWQTFQLVRTAVREIVSGAEPGALIRKVHCDWYREMFMPCVNAGLIAPQALAGYRNNAVYIRGSRHMPPHWEVVSDAMSALFDLLEDETEPFVRAVLGHWLLGYIHPYPDGNGRIARFVMNAALASGGYPWTVIRVEERDVYLAALESASTDQDIEPFAQFVADRVTWSLEQAAS